MQNINYNNINSSLVIATNLSDQNPAIKIYGPKHQDKDIIIRLKRAGILERIYRGIKGNQLVPLHVIDRNDYSNRIVYVKIKSLAKVLDIDKKELKNSQDL